MNPENVLMLLLLAPAFVSSLTVHEFAHAWAAHRLGDDTAKQMGRLSLDPLVHLDFWGTAMMVLAILSGWPLIGWAKPVPVNPNNFENRRRDDVLVAIAGPISNIIQAVIWLLLMAVFLFGLKISGHEMGIDALFSILQRDPRTSSWISIVMTVITYGVIINIILAAFNMIPLPPLDGHWVLMGLEIPGINQIFTAIRPWSFIIIFALILIPPFNSYFVSYLNYFVNLAFSAIIRVTMFFV